MWASIFPGQGSQSVGMGRLFIDNFGAITNPLIEETSDLLSQNFRKLILEGPESDLTLTSNTQPALVLVSTMMSKSLEQVIGRPFKFSAGHSLGEYSALVSQGAISFADAIKSVRIRGQSMQDAVPVGQGAMCAVLGTSDTYVVELCKWVDSESGFSPLEPANFNAPGQVVVSGSSKAVEWMRANYSSDKIPGGQKAKFIPLNVSAPFHCSMMKPAQEKMKLILSDMKFAKPENPIVQNVTARSENMPEKIRENLISQISSPVKWTQSVIEFKNLGVTRFVEMGPGKVLSGLVKKIDSEAFKSFNIMSLEDIKLLEQEVKSNS